MIPSGSRIDTDLGLIENSSGNPIAVKTSLLAQAGDTMIRVFEAGSFQIAGATVTGTHALAFVSDDVFVLTGRMSLRATAKVDGPGATVGGACKGRDNHPYPSATGCPSNEYGVAGAGNSHAGGIGGVDDFENVGAAVTAFSPLLGGCRGGDQRSLDELSIWRYGGGGGGAIQIVSNHEINLSGAALLDVGGGGGDVSAGGGSGGNLVLEAPKVVIGAGGGIAANGGAGGGCGRSGADGPASAAIAVGAVCTYFLGGSGGSGISRPAFGGITSNTNMCYSASSPCRGPYGGGGGSGGRARIATRDGIVRTDPGSITNVAVTTAVLPPE